MFFLYFQIAQFEHCLNFAAEFVVNNECAEEKNIKERTKEIMKRLCYCYVIDYQHSLTLAVSFWNFNELVPDVNTIITSKVIEREC